MLRLMGMALMCGMLSFSARALWADILLEEDFEGEVVVVPWMQEGGWFGSELGVGKRVSEETAASGKRSLEFTVEQGAKGSGGFFHKVKPVELMYVRYYRMFAKDWEWWKEGYGPHDTEIYGGKFVRPTDKDIGVYTDFWRTGDTMLRVGTPLQKGVPNMREQLGDRYGKLTPGNGFPWNVAEPDKIVPGKWFCVETMAKLNTPGEKDGVVKLWVNGKLVTSVEDLILRDEEHADITFDMWFLGPYYHPGVPKTQKTYIDAIVVSTSPIGPLAEDKKSTGLKEQEAADAKQGAAPGAAQPVGPQPGKQ